MSAKKYKVGITFGAFSPLHFGHINLFINAKEMCDELIVCMSDDDYIKDKKGYSPNIPFIDRFKHLCVISIIDKIDFQTIAFGKKEAVDRYNPDVIFVGSDWTPATYSGEGLGVPVEYLPHTDGISSTILRKIMSKK